MAVSKCPGCGADLTNEQKECPYCGAKNPNYVAPKPVVKPTFTYNSSGPQPAPASGSSINWLVFIILLFIFWPAAIVYLVLRK